MSNSTIKEQSLSPTSGNLQLKTTAKELEPAGLDERIWMALASAAEKKALNTVVLDLREIASFTDYFIIASGTNERQVQAISDEVVETLKKSGTRVIRVEGYKTAEWILLLSFIRAARDDEVVSKAGDLAQIQHDGVERFLFRSAHQSHPDSFVESGRFQLLRCGFELQVPACRAQ